MILCGWTNSIVARISAKMGMFQGNIVSHTSNTQCAGSSSLRVHALGTTDKNWVGHEEVELREHARGSLSSLSRLRGVPSSVIIAAGSYKLRPLLLVCST